MFEMVLNTALLTRNASQKPALNQRQGLKLKHIESLINELESLINENSLVDQTL